MLSDQTAQSLARLEELEKQLDSVVRENNQLELQELLQDFKLQQHYGPVELHNELVRLEADFYAKNSPENVKYAIQENERKIQQHQLEMQSLAAAVEEKRQRLQQIIAEASEFRQTSAMRRPVQHCTESVEAAAREFAYKIDSVNEDELVQYLARGRRTGSLEEMFEKVKRLAEVRFDRVYQEKLRQCLQELISRVDHLRYEINKESAREYADQLVSSLDRVTKEMTNEDDVESIVERFGLGTRDGACDLWSDVEQRLAEVQVLRETLRKNIEQTRIDEQLPAEFTSCEREKVAMRQCLDTLIESNRRMHEHIEQLRGKGWINVKLCSIDEVVEIAARYQQLKDAMKE